jgi:hypothetical protein
MSLASPVGNPQKDCDSPAVGKWAAVPCGCSCVQSPLPSIVHPWSAAYMWYFCTPVSAWLLLPRSAQLCLFRHPKKLRGKQGAEDREPVVGGVVSSQLGEGRH